MKKLFVIDAYSLIYRAYYAFIRNPRFNSKGLNTSAIFGFTNYILDIYYNEHPDYLMVAFDPPTETFRHKIYPQYKANREETPEDIRRSVPLIKQLLETFGIYHLHVEQFEADDLIGSIAGTFGKDDTEVYMYTSDKDYVQLINDHVFLYKPGKAGGKNEKITVDNLMETYFLEHPLQMIDFLALTGDASDNIPGAKGIGEVTARKLIREYHSVDKLLENINTLTGKLKENIENSKDNILLSKHLVTINKDIPLPFTLEQLRLPPLDLQKIKPVLDDLEFKTIYQRMLEKEKKPLHTPSKQPGLFDFLEEAEEQPAENPSTLLTIKDVPHDYKTIQGKEAISSLVAYLKNFSEICFDTETTGLSSIDSDIVGLSFCVKAGEAFYIPFPASYSESKEILQDFSPLFSDKSILKIGQNIKFDINILRKYDIETEGEYFDTMIAHYLIQPDLKHNMDFMAGQYLNYQPISIERLIGKKGKQQLSMRDVALETISEYACEDADVTFKLKEILVKEVSNKKLETLAYTIEMPLIRVLSTMELNGVSIDAGMLKNYAVALQQEADSIEKEIYTLTGEVFNLNSPKQLGEVLFDKLKITNNPPKTKTKQYATGEEVLEKLTDTHPVVLKILEYRSFKKLISTYVEALPHYINNTTGRIHTSFNQAWVSTGRLSSDNPNLQNIPIRDARGKEIRKAFIPSEGNELISADYSQIELRIMAHLSQDENMVQAFLKGDDIHAATAAKIYNIPLGEVTSDMRRKAKTANFGIIYGISAFGLSQRLSISRQEAKELIDGYFRTFPSVRQYMNNTIMQARDQGYAETIFGRRRYLPDILSKNTVVRGFAERNAINAPIQGTAADIIKLGMIAIHREMKKEKLQSRMILQVHDELVFDVVPREIETLKKIIKENMEGVVSLRVPLLVDIGIGKNWLEAH